MELKVGMYVRFKDKRGIQYIRKITSVNTEKPERRYAAIYIDKDANNCNRVSLKNIVGEPSFNLIDLIEVGDYVNSHKVLKINRVNIPGLLNVTVEKPDFRYCVNESVFNKDIKDIVTKEQFEACKYVVERDNHE